jgi:Polysaccharide deacetylase
MDAKRAAISGLSMLALCAWTRLPEASPRQAKTGVVDYTSVPQPEAEAGCELGPPSNDPPGFYRGDTWTKGQVVLTFDDGPHPYATPKVLDLLARHRFHATFFVVGHNITSKTFRLIKRMVAEGHSLGSHSYNHDVGMGFHDNGERTVEYIRGQHETTRILIDLALVAESEKEFDALFNRVFGTKTPVYLGASALRTDWPAFVARHRALLLERGYRGEARPYAVKFSRPPGGGPYLGAAGSLKRPYGAALGRSGLLNVMWHGESGDTNPERRDDRAFLETNILLYARRGGILLIHDYMRHDAMATALGRMAADPRIVVVPLERAVQEKFRCGLEQLALSGFAG